MPSDRNGVPFPPVRRLGPDDLRHCVRLSVDRGWLPEQAKWALLLEVSEVFGVGAPDGGGAGLAGAVVLTRYGAVTLVATDLGKPLYDKLGFRTIRRGAAFTGRFRADPAATLTTDNSKMRTRQATAADMAAIMDVDKAAFGADRSRPPGDLARLFAPISIALA